MNVGIKLIWWISKMHKFIMDAIEKTLKDYGIDWILTERGDSFTDLMAELESALSEVLE